MELPEEFRRHMRDILGDEEYQEFISEYDDKKREYGLHRNPLKADREQFESVLPFRLERSEWAEEAYYYDPEQRPGKSAFHETGAYYIQEPSAMAVVPLLGPEPGENICDLCAAPGGKSTQIAGRMDRRGLLVSNEIISGRAEILSQNIERMGIGNCVVTNETPQRMAVLFPSFFDRVLVDAPCSGEGMFRKDDTAIQEWSMENVGMCAQRQKMILDCAAQMLRPGGRMVYSTCTFEPAEDEMMAADFLKSHPGWDTVAVGCSAGEEHGRSRWGLDEGHISGTVRLWPQNSRGEGHFAAVFVKPGELVISSQEKDTYAAVKKKSSINNKGKKLSDAIYAAEEVLKGICSENVRNFIADSYRLIDFGGNVYAMPVSMNRTAGMQIKRPGLQIVAVNDKGSRISYNPAHALAMFLRPEEALMVYEMNKSEAAGYIRGESIQTGETGLIRKDGVPEDGWVLMVYSGFSAGWGKKVGRTIKNHYPKGLRKNI